MCEIVSPQFYDEAPCSGEVLEKVIGQLRERTEKFNKEVEECKKLRRILEGRVVKAMPATAGIETDENGSLMRGDMEFRIVPGSKPSEKAVNLAKLLFMELQLSTQMCEASLSGEACRHSFGVCKTEIVKKAVLDRFKQNC